MSKFTLNTTTLQNVVTKAIKAAGFNKLLPITSMIGLRNESDKLCLTTSDGTNYLYVYTGISADEDFSVVVNAEMFAKLVSKLTSENVTLTITNEALVVTGNGEYILALQLNDTGDVLEYPNPYASSEIEDKSVKINKSVIDIMLNSIKPSLSTVAGSLYTNYYVGDVIIATDKAMFSSFDDSSFGEGCLLSREFVDLLGLMGDETDLSISSEAIIAKSDNLILYAKKGESADGFQVDKLLNILSIEMDSYCKINKQALLSTLERISIFVGEFEDNVIKLHFTDKSIEIQSMSSSGIESVDYMEHKSATDFTAKINVAMLITQLKAYGSDSVEIYYGNDKLLKLKDGKLTQVIAYVI